MTGAFSFVGSKKHVLPMLIRIELITLSLIIINITKETRKVLPVLTILVLIVCEGSAGLTIMLKRVKSKGNDLITNTLI